MIQRSWSISHRARWSIAKNSNHQHNAHLRQSQSMCPFVFVAKLRILSLRCSSQPLHFVDAVVTNIFSVAKQAGSTAKAIFNTLQATEEVRELVASIIEQLIL